MQLRDAVVVITGAGSGIGAAMARRFAAEGAAGIVVSDVNSEGARAVAEEVGGTADSTDVADAAAIAALVQRTLEQHGRIDLFCSNAGVTGGGGLEVADADWERIFRINVLAHVYAARAVLPSMLERGRGYLLNTASAAGLLTSPSDAPYSVTKHGAVALAEWLSVTYGDRGIGVSALCPLGVATPLLMDGLNAGHPAAKAVAASGNIISAEDVAQAVVDGLADERFLILPHPEVAKYYAQKASDPGRWLAGLRRLVRQSEERSN